MINWIKNKFQDSPDCKMLFGEAIKCYSIEAYRASLLLSYLGFLTYIKEMIMNSQKPNNIKNSRWDNITKELTNENKWEGRFNFKPIFVQFFIKINIWLLSISGIRFDVIS